MKKIFISSLLVLSACRPFIIVAPPAFPPSDAYGMQSTFIVRIESDTFYEGHVGSRSVHGASGAASYPIYPGECYMIRKTRTSGLLRMFVTYSTYYVGGNFPKFSDRATTTAFGVISGCL